MKIRAHKESHIIELDDGSEGRIFPGDVDLTLNWKPETALAVETSTTRSVRMRLSPRPIRAVCESFPPGSAGRWAK